MARRPIVIHPEQTDPLDDAVSDDRLNIADDLANALEALRPADQGSVKGILYRVPAGNGKYEWIREVYPPFDMNGIMQALKEEFGGGDFCLRLMADGKIRKNINFAIVKDKTPLLAPQGFGGGGDMMTMFQMMMSMQNQSAQAAQAAADRQMQMLMASNQQSTQMMLGMVTAMTGNREKMSDIIPMFAALKPDNPGGGMKEAVETMVLMKGILNGDPEKPGFDADDIVGSVLKLGGPIVGAVGKAFSERRGTATNPAPVYEPPPESGQLMLPQSAPPSESGNLVLDTIRDDVLHCFRRGHDPERAAELVYDTIEAAGVTEGQINELVAAFAVSADWLGELAANGIDLRGNPEWAEQFLQALIRVHSDAVSGSDDFEGQERGAANPGAHGAAGAGGLNGDAGSQPGREPDD